MHYSGIFRSIEW